MWRTLRLAFDHRQERLAFGRAVSSLSIRYLRSRRVPFEGRWLDVGTGVGAMPEALRDAGATVVALDVRDQRDPRAKAEPFVLGSGERLPFRPEAFDNVSSANVLEHVPDPWTLIDELVRVCRPGGTVYLSWTNWYSPFGGHDWSPFHYAGPRLGPRLYRALRGKEPMHVPGRTLFPVHVGTVIRGLSSRPVRIVEVVPRYWPQLRSLARVPGLREVALWNCVILMRKLPVPPERRRPFESGRGGGGAAPTAPPHHDGGQAERQGEA
jgi:SAM-dependent methyltransferase